MAHKPATLMMGLALLLALGLRAEAQNAAPQGDSDAAQTATSREIGAIPPIFPTLPPEAAAMSLQCAVPQSEVARSSPLVNTAARLESGNTLRVLAMGSSAFWSAGGLSAPRSYPSQLETILEAVWKGVDVQIINRGVSGEIAATSSRRLINEAAILRPTLVLWQVGTADAVARVGVAEFEDRVRATVRLLRENHIDVILVGLQYTPKFARDSHFFAIRAALDKIAAEENLLYVRRYQAMGFIANTRANLNILADDDFKMADLGYPCMAEHIAQAVVANIFLRRNGDRRGAAPAKPN
ncbi:MAG: family lipase [Hyphomicrobiales bacterium]|nr:family lipase [Hyphomicrobiales bacterium]